MFTHSGANHSISATVQHGHRCHVLQLWSQILSLIVSNLIILTADTGPTRFYANRTSPCFLRKPQIVAGDDTLFRNFYLHVPCVLKGLAVFVRQGTEVSVAHRAGTRSEQLNQRVAEKIELNQLYFGDQAAWREDVMAWVDKDSRLKSRAEKRLTITNFDESCLRRRLFM